MWQIWLIAVGVFLVVEIITIGFLFFWLAIGALITMFVSFLTDNVIIQFATFVISSGLLIFFTRPLINKFTKNDKTVTNAFSIIGKRGIVLKDINPETGEGQIKVGSEVWSAKSSNNQPISKGSNIEILKIDGVKVIVK